MPSSRIPKCMLRPPQLPASRSDSPFMSVSVDSARSAEPPTSVFTTGPIALMIFCEEARVAIAPSLGVNCGSAFCQPAGSSPASAAVSSAARSGNAFW